MVNIQLNILSSNTVLTVNFVILYSVTLWQVFLQFEKINLAYGCHVHVSGMMFQSFLPKRCNPTCLCILNESSNCSLNIYNVLLQNVHLR